MACHCSSRWVLVKQPSFSVCAATGRKKTSVPMFSVTSSPDSISGESFQNEAVSISYRSRTTSQSSLASALRWNEAFCPPTAGFWPMAIKPFTPPLAISTMNAMCEWSPVICGR